MPQSQPSGRPTGEPILKLSQLESDRNLARTADFRPGSTIEEARALRGPDRHPPLPSSPAETRDAEPMRKITANDKD
jgi:hypothetical protein